MKKTKKEKEIKKTKKPKKKRKEKRPLPPLPLTESEELLKKSEEEKKSEKEKKSEEEKDFGPGITKEEELFEGEKILDQQDILAICKEIPDIGFQVWKRFDPGIELLSEEAKSRIAKPLARIVYRKNFDKWVKDEFYLVFLLGLEISKRIKPKKKNVKNNSGEKGPGKDDARP